MGARLTLDDVRAAAERIRPHLAPHPAAAEPRRGDSGVGPPAQARVLAAHRVVQGPRGAEPHGRPGRRRAAARGRHRLRRQPRPRGRLRRAGAWEASLRATVFVPTSAPRAKLDKLRRFPVEVRQVGDTYDDTVEARRGLREGDRGDPGPRLRGPADRRRARERRRWRWSRSVRTSGPSSCRWAAAG